MEQEPLQGPSVMGQPEDIKRWIREFGLKRTIEWNKEVIEDLVRTINGD